MAEDTHDEPKGHRTQIIVAVITLIGVLGGAAIANWDKLFPPQSLPAGQQEEPRQRQPTDTDAIPAGYTEQASYIGNCSQRPSGTVCVRYSDGYVWLVDESITSHREEGTWNGHTVMVASGSRSDFYHIAGTNYIKRVRR